MRMNIIIPIHPETPIIQAVRFATRHGVGLYTDGNVAVLADQQPADKPHVLVRADLPNFEEK